MRLVHRKDCSKNVLVAHRKNLPSCILKIFALSKNFRSTEKKVIKEIVYHKRISRLTWLTLGHFDSSDTNWPHIALQSRDNKVIRNLASKTIMKTITIFEQFCKYNSIHLWVRATQISKLSLDSLELSLDSRNWHRISESILYRMKSYPWWL